MGEDISLPSSLSLEISLELLVEVGGDRGSNRMKYYYIKAVRVINTDCPGPFLITMARYSSVPFPQKAQSPDPEMQFAAVQAARCVLHCQQLGSVM